MSGEKLFHCFAYFWTQPLIIFETTPILATKFVFWLKTKVDSLQKQVKIVEFFFFLDFLQRTIITANSSVIRNFLLN